MSGSLDPKFIVTYTARGNTDCCKKFNTIKLYFQTDIVQVRFI